VLFGESSFFKHFLMAQVDLKVVLLGKHSVGKTCLVERFLHGKFKDNTVATVGAAFGAKKLDINGKEITLGIWDTAGQERYESMSRIYYRSAKAAIVCFDLSDPSSFDKVRFWIDELLQNEESCDIYIAGTKLDAIGSIVHLPEEVREYATKIGAKIFQTSAKTGAGIDELFHDIAQSFVKKTMMSSSSIGGLIGSSSNSSSSSSSSSYSPPSSSSSSHTSNSSKNSCSC